jgi:uncharacterized protein YjbI with pentapeptide repeats
MISFSLRGRVLGIAASAVVAVGTVVLWSGAASAVTCPTVASGTGLVTPAPAPSVNWSHCDLAEANLSGADLEGANLEYVNLTGANLSNAAMKYSAIDGADLADTDLAGTAMAGIETVVGVSSGGIIGTPASLPGISWEPASIVDGYLVGQDVNLNDADLATADLDGIDFEAASFVDADLAGANLTDASIDGNLAGANLSGTNLTDAYLNGVSSGGITGTPSKLPADWQLADGYLIGPGAGLADANLADVNLADADVQSADLDEANLTDADLSRANLAGAGLESATLAGTNLSGANLAELSSGSIAGTPASLPADWTLRNGYLFGPKAWFIGTDLSGQNLSDLDLAGASLENSDLTGANLSGTNAADADFTGATITDTDLARTVLAGADLEEIEPGGGVTGTPASLPADWSLRSGWLIGPYVLLYSVDLDGVNLSGTDMTSAVIADFTTLTGANLTGADLAYAFLSADFTKADLSGADLFGAYPNDDSTWTDATCPDGSSASAHDGNCMNALAFRFAGFITPKPGSTVKASAGHVTVHFKLATTSGAAISASVANTIGAAKAVRVTLAGPGIKATTAYCSWTSSASEFTCTITDPHGIEKGKSHSYTIIADEEPGTSFQTPPSLGKAANPETIHFD